jgi:F0F1-type ATP synthase assembly protein I
MWLQKNWGEGRKCSIWQMSQKYIIYHFSLNSKINKIAIYQIIHIKVIVVDYKICQQEHLVNFHLFVHYLLVMVVQILLL